MKVLVMHDKPGFKSQLSYVFDMLLAYSLGLDYEIVAHPAGAYEDSLIILYGGDNLDTVPGRLKLHIRSSDFFGPGYLTIDSLPNSPLDWAVVDDERLPFLYRAEGYLEGQSILVTEDGDSVAVQGRSKGGRFIQTNLDFVASSFFMLSRYEEALIQEQDQFNRFPLEAHLAFREGFWRIPVVNLYAKLLGDWIVELTSGGLRPNPPSYPDGRRFGLCLTHDVDHPRKFTPVGLLKTPAKVLLRRESPKALYQIGDYFLTGRDPFWNFDQIIELERDHGFSSTFFLTAGGRHDRDPAYGDDPAARTRLCETISDLGAEIGLHGSFESYANSRLLSDEWAELNRCTTVKGGRQHYLRLNVQRSFTAMEEAGFLYDCTLAFSGEMGFRSGFAVPHYMFNLEEDRPFRILEIPLVVMDRSIWASCCPNSEPDRIWEEMLQVLDLVRQYNGCVSVLWHNQFFDPVSFPGYRSVYRSLLMWLRNNDGWGASGAQVYDWFVTRLEGLQYVSDS